MDGTAPVVEGKPLSPCDDGRMAESAPLGRRIEVLDGVRGLAILMVIVFHTMHLRFSESESLVCSQFLGFGTGLLWCGVDLFFVLSGYLITGILIDSRGSSRYFINFFARRTVRIFPLYYAVLFLLLVVFPWMVSVLDLGNVSLRLALAKLVENQAYLWFYMQNYLQATERSTLPGLGHFWSLAVEEQFYVVWPFLVYFLSKVRFFWLCAGIVVLLPFVRLGLYSAGVEGWAIRQWTFTRIDSLVAGSLAAMVIRDPLLVLLVRPWLSLFFWAAFAGIVAGAAIDGVAAGGGFMCTFGYSAFGLLFSSWILRLLIEPSGRCSRLLKFPFLAFLGKFSYGLYVFHWPVVHGVRAMVARLTKGETAYAFLFENGLLLALAEFSVVLAVSTLIAQASWYLWEKPWLSLKRHFEYRD